jgi:alkylation response protein AidB-like acyl-CoA dehydrogenase
MQWAERSIEVAIATQLAYRVVSMQVAGQIPNAEASIAKLYSSELLQRVSRTALRMLGTRGIQTGREAPLRGLPAYSYVRTVASTIAGGTSEIQRGIIAGRGLGLPRG